jgi:hypothetical protein
MIVDYDTLIRVHRQRDGLLPCASSFVSSL